MCIVAVNQPLIISAKDVMVSPVSVLLLVAFTKPSVIMDNCCGKDPFSFGINVATILDFCYNLHGGA